LIGSPGFYTDLAVFFEAVSAERSARKADIGWAWQGAIMNVLDTRTEVGKAALRGLSFLTQFRNTASNAFVFASRVAKFGVIEGIESIKDDIDNHLHFYWRQLRSAKKMFLELQKEKPLENKAARDAIEDLFMRLVIDEDIEV
jgi:hypothetical protein